MNTNFMLLSMACAGTIVIAAGVTLIVLLIRGKNTTPNTARPASNPNWTRWFPYLGIAILLSFWSFWISLLFLFVAWLLSLNPDKDSSYEVGANEKNTAKRVYNWLFWSSLITVPIYLITLSSMSYQAPHNARVFAAILPLIFHAPLLLGLTSKSAFVYRHTQQGILLIAIRAVTASIVTSADLWWIFFLGNGSLWLFGTIWGRNQVIRGERSWMKRQDQVFKEKIITVPESKIPQANRLTESDKKLKQIIEALSPQEKLNAKARALEAFQSGIQGEVRTNAVAILTFLGEVEQF